MEKIWYILNPTTFEPNEIKISNLNNKNILMLGRSDKFKRYEIGINTMKIIIEKEPEAKLYIVGIENNTYNNYLKKIVDELGLTKKIILKKLISSPESML